MRRAPPRRTPATFRSKLVSLAIPVPHSAMHVGHACGERTLDAALPRRRGSGATTSRVRKRNGRVPQSRDRPLGVSAGVSRRVHFWKPNRHMHGRHMQRRHLRFCQPLVRSTRAGTTYPKPAHDNLPQQRGSEEGNWGHGVASTAPPPPTGPTGNWRRKWPGGYAPHHFTSPQPHRSPHTPVPQTAI